MNISAETKISFLIKQNPAAIDAIASINKHFEKLRNPILRKVLASRITIADAAKIGGCSVNDFFEKLLPLGFKINTEEDIYTIPPVDLASERPSFMNELDMSNIIRLDVRPDLESGKDPFQKITQTLASMSQNNVLLIINSFEPLPLITILRGKGYECITQKTQDNVYHTYFKSTDKVKVNAKYKHRVLPDEKDEFNVKLESFAGKMKMVDVRKFGMPVPMIIILQELEILSEEQALFVQHKKIPQFLLPELEEKGFLWHIREDGEGDVKLLIYR